jgi:hypothetical protein
MAAPKAEPSASPTCAAMLMLFGESCALDPDGEGVAKLGISVEGKTLVIAVRRLSVAEVVVEDTSTVDTDKKEVLSCFASEFVVDCAFAPLEVIDGCVATVDG